MHGVKIINPGGYTTIQDRGRFGFQDLGIPVCGPLDHFAFTVANLLVNNPENAAVMEITVMGPYLEIQKEMDIALAGAQMKLAVNNKPMEPWRSIRVKPGDTVTIGQVTSGCRAYLAFGGTIDVPEIMGSRATYVGGKIGGFKGRPLQKGDEIKILDSSLLKKELVLPAQFIPTYETQAQVRVVPGPQDDYFDQGFDILFGSEYMVTAKADRMGYRLQGPCVPIKDKMPKSIISEPSVPGSIQIPADGQPIVLMVEQTVGGYAKIATVISPDLSIVAQTTPGDKIQFKKVDLDTAYIAARQEQDKLNQILERLS